MVGLSHVKVGTAQNQIKLYFSFLLLFYSYKPNFTLHLIILHFFYYNSFFPLSVCLILNFCLSLSFSLSVFLYLFISFFLSPSYYDYNPLSFLLSHSHYNYLSLTYTHTQTLSLSLSLSLLSFSISIQNILSYLFCIMGIVNFNLTLNLNQRVNFVS